MIPKSIQPSKIHFRPMRPMAGANGGASRESLCARGQTYCMGNNQTQRFAHEVFVGKPCGKAHRQPAKEGKQTTQKSETRALYALVKHHKNRAFGPKQHPKFHFIDKRKEAFYNQIIGVPFAKKTNGWDASARNSPRIWTEVCFVLRRCKRHGFCVLYAPGCRAFLGAVLNQHRKPQQCFSLAALAGANGKPYAQGKNTDRASIFRKKEKPCSERLHKN
jgi:hypothetical protein